MKLNVRSYIHRTLSNQYSECYAKFTTQLTSDAVLFDCLVFSPPLLAFSCLKVSHLLIFFSFLLFPCSNGKQLACGQLRTFERLSFLLFSKPYIP